MGCQNLKTHKVVIDKIVIDKLNKSFYLRVKL